MPAPDLKSGCMPLLDGRRHVRHPSTLQCYLRVGCPSHPHNGQTFEWSELARGAALRGTTLQLTSLQTPPMAAGASKGSGTGMRAQLCVRLVRPRAANASRRTSTGMFAQRCCVRLARTHAVESSRSNGAGVLAWANRARTCSSSVRVLGLRDRVLPERSYERRCWPFCRHATGCHGSATRLPRRHVGDAPRPLLQLVRPLYRRAASRVAVFTAPLKPRGTRAESRPSWLGRASPRTQREARYQTNIFKNVAVPAQGRGSFDSAIAAVTCSNPPGFSCRVG